MDAEKLIFNQDHFKILPIKKDKNVVSYQLIKKIILEK